MKKYLFPLVFLLVFVPFLHAQETEMQPYTNCLGELSLNVPEGWLVQDTPQQSDFGISLYNHLDVAAAESVESSALPAGEAMRVEVNYLSKVQVEEEMGDLGIESAADLVNLLVQMSDFDEIEMSEPAVLEVEGGTAAYNLVLDNEMQWLLAAWDTDSALVVIFASVNAAEFSDEQEAMLLEVVKSIQIDAERLTEAKSENWYFNDACRFEMNYGETWFRDEQVEFTLYNSPEAAGRIDGFFGVPQSGQLAVRVFTPENFVTEAFYNMPDVIPQTPEEIIATIGSSFIIPGTLTVREPVEITIAGYNALQADVQVDRFGSEAEARIYVVELKDGKFATLYAEAAPGEIAAFESDIASLLERISYVPDAFGFRGE